MRFRILKKMNWRYILGEILLLFISINLALWFSNWNTTKKMAKDKGIAMEKIVEEIEGNQKELTVALENNQHILTAYYAYKEVFSNNTSHVQATPKQLATLEQQYPGFFMVTDSTLAEDGVYQYTGQTKINLELPDLTAIAWNITTSLDISHELDYECLYQLESMYNLQSRVSREIDKSADALQRRDLDQLLHVLEFVNQLSTQLTQSYEEALEKIPSCT